MRFEDLPPKMRAQVEQQFGAKTTRAKPSRAGVGLSAPCPGHCGCGQAFPTAAKWERHVDRDHGGHGRWSIDLPTARTSRRPIR